MIITHRKLRSIIKETLQETIEVMGYDADGDLVNVNVPNSVFMDLRHLRDIELAVKDYMGEQIKLPVLKLTPESLYVLKSTTSAL